MKNLIPPFIQEQSMKNLDQGNFRAYAMFIDLSGFTPLTETLMKRGNEGAEQLSIILNDIFAPMVALVYKRGGMIPYFAGDAFTAIFPLERNDINASAFLQTAQDIRDLFSKEGFKQKQFGDFSIGIKIGLSFGDIEWGIIGNKYKQFYFRGAAIDNSAESDRYAVDKDIILDQHMIEALEGKGLEVEALEGGFYKLAKDIKGNTLIKKASDLAPLKKSVAKLFLPKAVIEYNQSGEFRNVISVFISFTGVENHDLLNEFATMVLDEINRFSGYFKEIDFGDKGGVMLAFFGAPVSFENNEERALEFIFAIKEQVDQLEKKGFKFRAGIASGLAYTGIVGGEQRCQYAAVGNQVNLAARLMIKAKWGEILVDDELQKNSGFKFAYLGDNKYKGIDEVVSTHQLLGRNLDEKPSYSGEMMGRNLELAKLKSIATPILQGKFAGITRIYGEAGIGKSRLTYELRNVLLSQRDINWYTCPADQILKKPFNPFVAHLRAFFNQSPENNYEQNKAQFEKKFKRLLKDSDVPEHPESVKITRELKRTESILAAQIGILYPDSLWERLDAKGRFQNTLSAFENFFIAGSLLKPLVIELEDGHWYDNSSIDFLSGLISKLKYYPVFILMTSRYKDDGTKPFLFTKKVLAKHQINPSEIDLSILQPKALKSFAESKLQGKIHPDFEALLAKASNGNPFYLEQILAYFKESDLLKQEDDLWNIKDPSIKLSGSINSILMARIDRLSTLVKETVKAAAVIGREFEIPVLTEVMKQNEEFVHRNGNTISVLKEQVRTAEKGQIWQAVNELRYMFKHSLLRETVYDMQLRTRLRKLHLLIGSAIEKLYPLNLEEKYIDLAFHFGQADVIEKTTEYLEKAADFAKNNYQNRQAIDFYEKLTEILEAKGDTARLTKTLLKEGSVLELIGEWDTCETIYLKAYKTAEKTNDPVLLGRAHNDLGRLLILKGDYETARKYLEKAADYFEEQADDLGNFKVLGDLGNLYFRQGNYEKAKSYFTKSIAISNKVPYTSSFAQIVANLGLTHMNLGDYDDGVQQQLSALSKCQAANDKQGMATLHTNLGIVYQEKGDFDDALKHFNDGLSISEELGNKLLKAIATGCIGSIYQQKGNYGLALQNFIEDLRLCEELGDKQGTAIALGLIGELRSIEGEFDIAIQYIEKNLELCEELGYQKGIAKAVNTLGDIYFFRKEYDKSVIHYQRAIDVSRNIDNLLVLGMSLAEQGEVYIEMNQPQKAKDQAAELLDIANHLNNDELEMRGKILAIKITWMEGDKETAENILTDWLAQSEGQNNETKANIHYELSKMVTSNNKHRLKALEIYKELYLKVPKHIFKLRIDELKSQV